MNMKWFRENVVLVTMVPTIIGIHYGWLKLQTMDDTSEKQITEQPIFSVNTNI